MSNSGGYIYILSSKSRRLYVGLTNDLERRLCEHKQKLVPGFTKRYNVYRLVYFEQADDILTAIAREKQIKGWLRQKKLDLIARSNPTWNDLSADW